LKTKKKRLAERTGKMWEKREKSTKNRKGDRLLVRRKRRLTKAGLTAKAIVKQEASGVVSKKNGRRGPSRET